MGILLVEDTELNRGILARRLIRKGHALILATDIDEGVLPAVHARAGASAGYWQA